jgi:hypothetical protein
MENSLKKQRKEIQKIDEKQLLESENVLQCYNHFKERYTERWREDNNLSFLDYIRSWIGYLRGELAYIKGKRMYRVIGHYIKDPIIYKVVYTRTNGIYIPLTIYAISDHKRKFRLYKNILKSKKEKN